MFGRKADRPAEPPVVTLGRATDCPVCGNLAYIEYINVERRMMRQRCRPCGYEWESYEGDPVPAPGTVRAQADS